MRVTITKSVTGEVWMIRFLDYPADSESGWSQPFNSYNTALRRCKIMNYTIVL